NPDEQEAGTADTPEATPESKGIPQHDLEQTIVLPFNDLEATEAILRTHADELAAVILEPVQGGFIPATNEFMRGLRSLTEELQQTDKPAATQESKSIPQHKIKQTIVLPLNDLEATEAILRTHADELAAVILEPVQGGFIPATNEFMRGLRSLTEELNIVLIFDEVKTRSEERRVGKESVYNIKPDLTALGKLIVGGFP